ncbi:LysR family transcriptional regulator [Pigmentiphaga soli]|uniref:LysR family transcriptional regulator n=1 Tax=Pigmentiphaga soli TaxID=1007095 RepID=A0ABP8HLM8_9BURK
MKDLNNIHVFVKVAEARNFTEASALLGITSSGVSRIISRFEAELGVRLFNRSTRSVSLTNDGISFLERCKQVLSMVAEAEDALFETHGSLKGTIRMTMPMGFGRRVVSSALPAFAARYPEITLEVEFSDRVVDLFYEPVDIAIVRGAVPDSRLIAKKLCTLDFIACASPEYIARHGEPATPEDLVHHHCMAYMGPQMSRHREWTFARNGRSFNMHVAGRVNANNAEALLDAAISGLGIVMLSTMYTAEAIRAGKLKMLLTEYIPPGTVVSATYLPNRNLSPRIRVFIDFLSRLVPSPPNWHGLPFETRRSPIATTA